MASLDPHGRPIPQLVYLLLASFVLMILSGIFFALGLPEDWARALFMATVLVWIVLGIALAVQGRMEVRAMERVAGTPVATPSPEEAEDATE
jgi:hypothetical protein